MTKRRTSHFVSSVCVCRCTMNAVVCMVTALDSVGHEDHDSDDLKLDYFYQNESEAAALTALATPPLTSRRFHRSAATLPVTPVEDSAASDRRNRFNRKAAERRKNITMLPSYLEPFVRAGHGFITARRDKELYTRSAGYLDEL